MAAPITTAKSVQPANSFPSRGVSSGFELPEVTREISKDKAYGEVESYKAVSELISPVSGTVLEANAAVVDDPSTFNADPYGAGWLVRVALSDPGELKGLLDPAGYRKVLGSS